MFDFSSLLIVDSVLKDTWITLRIIVVLFAFLYFLFSLLVVSQVEMMTHTVETDTSPLLRLLVVLNVVLAVIVTVLFLGFLLDTVQVSAFLHLG